MSHRRIRAYLASPYSVGDVAANVARAMDAADELICAGFAPYCPLLSHYLHIHHPHPYEEWMSLDLCFLPICDVVVRLPGLSAGADTEESRARELGIPVVHVDTTQPLAPQIEKVLK